MGPPTITPGRGWSRRPHYRPVTSLWQEGEAKCPVQIAAPPASAPIFGCPQFAGVPKRNMSGL